MYTFDEIGPIIGWLLGGIILLRNGWAAILDIIKAIKAPNDAQDKRLNALETHMKEIDGYLAQDKKRLDAVDDGNRVTQRALLALLDHALDGNNVDQMRSAKEELRNHLINR